MSQSLRFAARTAILLAAFAVTTAAQTSVWEFDPTHMNVGFSVRHLGVSNVNGNFGKASGTLAWDEKDITKSSVEATIDVASLNTQNADRDNHLRSADFFDAAKFPTITFKSTRVENAGNGRLRVTGNLTIKGVTKSVVLEVEGPSAPVKFGNATKSGLTATTRINRKDFGLTWNRVLETGGLAVGEEVKITLELELNK